MKILKNKPTNPGQKHTVHVPANTVVKVDHGFIGGVDVDLNMEEGSTLLFDPSLQGDWYIIFDKVFIANNVTFQLSSHDTTTKPPARPKADDGGAEQNARGGDDGYNGYPGGDTAELRLTIGDLDLNSWIFVRHAGKGGPGGQGGQGGNGGAGSWSHKGGDGGPGGLGGQGGHGGNVTPVVITYRNVIIRSRKKALRADLLPGTTDDYVVGAGGDAGVGGQGGTGGSGGAGGGKGYPQAGTQGAGPEGSFTQLVLKKI